MDKLSVRLEYERPENDLPQSSSAPSWVSLVCLPAGRKRKEEEMREREGGREEGRTGKG